MARRYLPCPAILIDPKMARLKIYKCALHSIGDPEYILLVVNPHDQSLSIMRSDEADQRAYCLERALLDNNWSPEIFSRSLVRDLFCINENWDKRKPYRVFGEADSNGSAVKFSFADAVWFLGEREWQ